MFENYLHLNIQGPQLSKEVWYQLQVGFILLDLRHLQAQGLNYALEIHTEKSRDGFRVSGVHLALRLIILWGLGFQVIQLRNKLITHFTRGRIP